MKDFTKRLKKLEFAKNLIKSKPNTWVELKNKKFNHYEKSTEIAFVYFNEIYDVANDEITYEVVRMSLGCALIGIPKLKQILKQEDIIKGAATKAFSKYGNLDFELHTNEIWIQQRDLPVEMKPLSYRPDFVNSVNEFIQEIKHLYEIA